MDSNTRNHLYDPNHTSSSGSGLLRFRSAPSSVLAAFVDDKTGFGSSGRFLNDLNGFDDKSPVSAALPPPPPPQPPEPSSFLGLPPHYPRQSKGMTMTTIGLDQYLDLNNHHLKPVGSNLLRQSSSPAGTFTNLSGQHGYGYAH